MKKQGVNPNPCLLKDKIGFRQLRTIKKDIDKVYKQTEDQLVDILSKEQFHEYKKAQEELRVEMRAGLKQRYLEERK